MTAKKSISQVHDKFFKSAMADPGVKEDFLKTYLPEEVVSKIDLQSIEEVSPKQISKKLSLQESDLLLKVKYQEKEVYIMALVEHKSYPDKKTPLQILKYMIGIWESYMEKSQKLPVVIPLIVYEGRKKWEYPQLESYFGDIDENQRKYIPLYEGVYQDFSLEADLNKMPENIFLRNFIIAIKMVYHPDKQVMLEELKESFRFSEEIDIQTIAEQYERLCLFIDDVRADLETEDFTNIIKDRGGQEVMAGVLAKMRKEAYEQGIERGIARGIERGVEKGRAEGVEEGIEKGIEKGREEEKIFLAKNLKEKGFSFEDIVNLTGLNINKIHTL